MQFLGFVGLLLFLIVTMIEMRRSRRNLDHQLEEMHEQHQRIMRNTEEMIRETEESRIRSQNWRRDLAVTLQTASQAQQSQPRQQSPRPQEARDAIRRIRSGHGESVYHLSEDQIRSITDFRTSLGNMLSADEMHAIAADLTRQNQRRQQAIQSQPIDNSVVHDGLKINEDA